MVEIGGYEFEVPLLTPERIQRIVSIGLPSAEMSLEHNLQARIKIVHDILSSVYVDLTTEFLEEHLTLAASDAVWKYASGQSL